jgi:hypothetical protein
MNARERLTASLSHRQPDRIPFDLGGTSVSSLHVKCIGQLRDYYGLPKEHVTAWSISSMAGIVPADLADRMGVDTAAAIARGGPFGMPRENLKLWTMPDGQQIYVPGLFNPTPDGNGGWYAHPQGDTSCPPSGHMPTKCYYFDNIEPKIDFDEDKLDPADNLEEFSVLGAADTQYLLRSVEEAWQTGRAVVLNMPGAGLGDISWVPGGGLKHPKGVRTIEEWYVSPLLRPEYIQAVFEGQTDIVLVNLKIINDACGDKIDVVYTCGTDFAHQNGLFLSPAVFRRVWAPYYRKVNDWIHANTKWKILKHSCGAVAQLLPCFIEAGFDIVNPVQTSAVGMDPATLKKEFGRDIAFWGGGVDTQHVLPLGTPEEVRKQVLERCEIFGRDGGFVFNAVHNVQNDVPAENIAAMVDAVKEFNGDL